MFKVGDKVRKVSNGTAVYPVGYEGEVTGFDPLSAGRIYVGKDWHSNAEDWELVEDKDKYPNGKHPHHDIILEYAKGAEIKMPYVGAIDEWREVPLPVFHPDHKYRGKPQQDPAVQAAKKKIEQAEQMLREANDELDRLGL